MNRRFHASVVMFLLLELIIQMIIIPAQAESLDEWNRSCRSKTAHATPVYAPNDFNLERLPVITLPANTYVKRSSSGDGIAAISYMTRDGMKGSGFVYTKDLTPAVVYYIGADGTSHGEQELQYWDMYDTYPPPGCSAMKGYEPEGYRSSSATKSPDNTPAATPPPAETSGASEASPNPSSNNTAKSKTSTPTATAATDVSAFTVIRTGFATCTIHRNGRDEEVATSELTFSSGVPEEQKVAYIHAPNSGYCWMREKPSDSSRTVRQCKAGTVVLVLETGKAWTKVQYRDEFTGYVRTSCLKFSGGTTETMGIGMLTYNGYGNGSTTINIRNAPDRRSVRIAEWKTGTEVIVFALRDGWYEIEYRGMHGFVMDKYLTMTE